MWHVSYNLHYGFPSLFICSTCLSSKSDTQSIFIAWTVSLDSPGPSFSDSVPSIICQATPLIVQDSALLSKPHFISICEILVDCITDYYIWRKSTQPPVQDLCFQVTTERHSTIAMEELLSQLFFMWPNLPHAISNHQHILLITYIDYALDGQAEKICTKQPA